MSEDTHDEVFAAMWPREAEPFRMRVEEGKVREFLTAIGCTLPEDPSELQVPPTFLTSMRHWTTPASEAFRFARFDPHRTLHASEEYEFVGPPLRVGQELVGRSRIEDVSERVDRANRPLRYATMVTEYTDEDGRVVARATLRGVETPKAAS